MIRTQIGSGRPIFSLPGKRFFTLMEQPELRIKLADKDARK